MAKAEIDLLPAGNAWVVLEFGGDTFRIVAPGAVQITAFQKNDDPDSGPIVDGVSFDIEDKRLIHVLVVIPLKGFQTLSGVKFVYLKTHHFRCVQSLPAEGRHSCR